MERTLATLSHPAVWFGGLAAAAFLVLSWALRGAPWGQAAPDDPDPKGRDRAVALAVLGLVLIAGGAVAAATAGVGWSLPAFAAGFVAEIAVIRRNRPHRHDRPALRRVVAFADTTLTASLLAGILVAGNVLAFRLGERPIDFTRERVHTLSPLTVAQLRSLDRPVRLVAFSGPRAAARRQIDRVIELIEMYRAANRRRVAIEAITLDAPADLDRLDDLARRAPEVNVTPAGVVIEYGEGPRTERVVVRGSDMFESVGPGATEFHGEDALTSALIRLREGKRFKVAVTVGHGEPPLDEVRPNRPGLGLLRDRLVALGAEVVALDLAREDVPGDVVAVVVAGPRSPFSAEEADRLSAYASRGGRVLAMIDGRTPTGLEGWLRSYGLAAGPGRIVERTRALAAPSAIVPATVGPDARHPIVTPLLNRRIAVPDASPLEVLPDAARADVEVETILRTGPRAWARSEAAGAAGPDPARDRAGPLAVGAAVAVRSGPRRLPRLVVFTSPALADNRFVAFEANLNLVVNALNWLRERPELVRLAPPTRRVGPRLAPDPNLPTRLVLLPTALALAAILGVGVFVILARRS